MELMALMELTEPKELSFAFYFFVFALAAFVGLELISKVPPTIHTPLMSGSNAISGVTVVGAILSAVRTATGLGGVPSVNEYLSDG